MPLTPILAATALSVLLLGALTQLVWWRSRLPGLARGWRVLDAFALLESTRVLVAAGAALPRAIRASAAWCGEPTAALALARSLEAGGSALDAAPLLTRFEVSLLLGAARAGQVVPTLTALSGARRVALEREIPDEAARIHVVGLGLAALGLVAVGGGWFWAYSVGVAS